MSLKKTYIRTTVVLMIVMLANVSAGSLEYYVGSNVVPTPTLSSDSESLVHFYGEGSYYYKTNVAGSNYVSLDGATPSTLLKIIRTSSGVSTRADETRSFASSGYGVTYEVSFENYEVNLEVVGPYGTEIYEDLSNGDFISYPSSSNRPMFVMKFVRINTGFNPYLFEFKDLALLDSSITTPVKKCTPSGEYTPASFSYDYSGFGEYVGISETHDSDTYKFFVGYKNLPSAGISSEDSLLSRNWTVPILIDSDNNYNVYSGSSLLLENGYRLNIIEINSNNQALFTLTEGGTEIDSGILEEGEIYVHRSAVSCSGSYIDDFPVFLIRVYSIFRGPETNALVVKGLFQIDENAYEVILNQPSIVSDSWSIDISAPNTIQNVTIGVHPDATDGFDSIDCWSLPPYPIDKVFLALDDCYSTNLKSGTEGASWALEVLVPEGQTTALDWDPAAVSGVTVKIMDGHTEILPDQTLTEGLHLLTVYAVYGDTFDPKPVISLNTPSGNVLRSFTLSGTISDDNLESALYRVNGQEYTLPYTQQGSIYSFNVPLSLADGIYTVEVEAIDSGSTSKSVDFKIDNTNPSVDMSVDVRADSALVYVSVSDDNPLSLVECRVEKGSNYTERDRIIIHNSDTFEHTFKHSNLGVGTYEINLFVEDCVGNLVLLFDEFEILDVGFPEITVISPVNGVTYSTFPEVNVITSEEATLIYNLNGYNETNVAQLPQHVINGENIFTVYATGLTGNTTSKGITFYFEPQSGGDGTETNPYKIYSASDLQSINNNLSAHYILMNDIDASETSTWNNGAGFVPIGTSAEMFTGSVDGNGHVIDGLTINREWTNAQGFIAYLGVGGEIKDIGLTNVSILGYQYVGSLAVFNHGTISNCFSTGSVTGGHNNVGGLVAGITSTGSILDSYSRCTVTCAGTQAGGLSGYNAGNIENSYAAGPVICANNKGGITGSNSYTVTNCYYDSEVTGCSDTGKGTPKTTAEMKSQSTFAGWNFDDVWSLSGQINEGYPFLQCIGGEPQSGEEGSESNPYKIYSISDLQAINNNLSAHYILMNDIDASATSTWNGGAGFVPIGTSGEMFTGSINGNDHTVSELTINRPLVNGQGLVAYLGEGGEIRNLGLVDVSVSGYQYVGALVVFNHGTISNCFSTGSVTGGHNNVGGLVSGSGPTGSVLDSYSMCNVTSAGTRAGGISGYNNGNIERCYATGFVDCVNIKGGITGGNSNVVADCYYNSETTGCSDTGKGTPKTTAEMKTQATYIGWDFNNVWSLSSQINDGYPFLFIC